MAVAWGHSVHCCSGHLVFGLQAAAGQLMLILTDINPAQDGPWKGLNPGLSPLQPDEDWMEIDQHYDEEIEEKRQMLRMKPTETFSVLPEVRAPRSWEM